MDKTSNYYLNNRYVDSSNIYIYNHINYENKSFPNLVHNKSDQNEFTN